MKSTLFPFYLIFLIVAASNVYAQTFDQITATSGNQTLGGKIVTVIPINGAGSGDTTVCGTFTHKYSGTSAAPKGFNFSFNTPVYHIRLHQVSMDAISGGAGDTLSFSINGAAYAINTNQVSIQPLSCTVPLSATTGAPVVYNGKLVATYPTTLYDKMIQLDIVTGAPINSFQVVGYGASPSQGLIYFADTGTYINQPFVDTAKCTGDSLYLFYGASTPFNTGNVFTAQLSDANGSFANPVPIGTATGAGTNPITCKLPQNILPGSGYRVRMVSSSPVRVSADNGKDIRINPIPVPIANVNMPCAGTPLNLTATALAGSTYSWSGPQSYTSTQQNPVINPSSLIHTGYYIVTATKDGCSAKDTVPATIKTKPITPYVFNNGAVCAGDTLYLGASSTLGSYSYSWTGPSSFSSTLQFPTILNANAAHAGVYSVVAISSEGCVSQPSTDTVVVNPAPAAPTVFSNSPVCGGSDILFAAGSTLGAALRWTGPNNYIVTGATPSINEATIANAGTYSVVAEVNGCSSAPATTNVVVNIVSSANAYAAPNDTVCPGGTASFVAMPQNAGPNPAFQWYTNGNPVLGATDTVFTTNSLQHNDRVYCRMVVTNVCLSPLTIYTNEVKMSVIPGYTVEPIVTVTATPAKPRPGEPVTFSATATSGGGVSPTYQWQRNGVNVPGATNITYSVNTLMPNERVRCIMTSSDVCASSNKDTSNVIVAKFPTNIDEVNGEGFVLYPNPNKGSFSLLGSFKGEKVEVEIVNAVGQVVYAKTIAPVAGVVKIDMGSYVAQGWYLLRVKDGDSAMQARFSVMD